MVALRFLLLLSTCITLCLADTITFNIGPITQWHTATSAGGPPLPTGTSVALHQNSNGDISLYLSDGVIEQLGSTLSSQCANGGDGSGCETAVQQVILDANYELQSRAVGLLLAAGGVFLAGFIYQIIELHRISNAQPIPVRLDLPASVASAVQADPTASDVVFKTADSDSGLELPVTDIPAATATAVVHTASLTSTGLVVSSATVSGTPGVSVQIKDSAAVTWMSNEAKTASQSCSGQKMHKRAAPCGLSGASVAAMGALDAGALQALLVLGPVELARFANGNELQAAAQAAFNAARAIPGLVEITDAVLQTVADIVTYIFAEFLSDTINAITDSIFIPQSEFDGAAQTGGAGITQTGGGTAEQTGGASTTRTNSCPSVSETPACVDATCGTNNAGPTCSSAGSYSGCPCLPTVTPYENPVDPNWLPAQQKVLGSLITWASSHPASISATATSKLSCTPDGAPWFSPTTWCECGTSTYPTLSSTSGQSAVNCAYTSLPATQLTPKSTAPVPTNTPGVGGVPGCAAVDYPDEQACINANYCNCGGTPVPFLTTTISGTKTTNCDYTVQPTASNCPPPTTTVPPAKPSSTTPTAPYSSCVPTQDPWKAFSRDAAYDKINAICQSYHNDKVVLSQGGIVNVPTKYLPDMQWQGSDYAANGATLVFSPVWSVLGCPDPNKPTPIDFGAQSVQWCLGNFLVAMDGCPQFSSGGQQYWKYGGQNVAACGLWSVWAQ